ncbi:o-succinylbenzoate--CoA ligase [Sporosarcina sp. HYO08]|uniref:o-succinylbenzoate--CoA ligase n=1 Tax=Sporosarcina sp. HYO08 TaxID=1759557 RepID=UPI000798E9E5|nr:o-succinylbenzoate--CoA ligase [Sporosarcina sp. HYO08]KXH86905.1 2-succinylbenzoate-CoA ligase [Sporosarcina sp. HYO08]
MIPNWLIQRAYLTPNKIALSFQDRAWTFAQLKEEALDYAEKLKANDLHEGDRIALLGPSNAEMVCMIHACLLVGLEIVMLNSRLSKKEMDWQLADAEAKAVIVADDLLGLLGSTAVPQLTFSHIQQSPRQPFRVADQWDDNRTITIMYTSGTTGFPKGVRQTVGNHVSSALSSVLNLGLHDDDVWLCSMPLFHISGFSILVRSAVYGMTVRLYEKFDAKAVANEIQQGTITRMSIVSVMLDQVMRELEAEQAKAHPNFQTMLAGGGSVPKDYIERANRLGMPVLQTYGMTETSSQTATLAASDAIRKIGSAGKPLFFNQIQIKDAKSPNDIGEVLIRGPHVTPGYIGKFEDIEPSENGWFPSGDIGYLDEEGYLFILDRRSDLIISGGENVYPAEIENVLAAHPNVIEAGVCGKDDPQWGMVPVAFVVANGEVTPAELRCFCEERLARYKVPTAFTFVETLPRNASNKLLRRELRSLLE